MSEKFLSFDNNAKQHLLKLINKSKFLTAIDIKLINELVRRLFRTNTGELGLFEPVPAELLRLGRQGHTVSKFFFLKEIKFAPTNDYTLWQTSEIVEYLKRDFTIEFTVFDSDSRYDFWELTQFSYHHSGNQVQEFATHFLPYLPGRLPFNGSPPEETETFGGDDFTVTSTSSDWGDEKSEQSTVQREISALSRPQLNKKSKVPLKYENITQWINEPASLDIEQIKELRSQASTEELQQVGNFFKNIDPDDASKIRVNYTALRLLTNVMDPFDLNSLTTGLYYQTLRTDETMLTTYSNAVKRMGKLVSRHYCKISDLQKNRGISREFSCLDPKQQKENVFLKVVKQHFNFLIYRLTGKVRTFELPNNCAFSAIQNAYEYNNQVFPKRRFLNIVNAMPDLKTRVTYYGIQADTMSYFIDQLNLPINLVDHDLRINMTIEDPERLLPGRINNINQHYTYTLDETKYDQYADGYHKAGLSHKQLAYCGRNPILTCLSGLGHAFTGFVRVALATLGSFAVTGIALDLSAWVLHLVHATTLVAGITFTVVFFVFLIATFGYLMYLLFK